MAAHIMATSTTTELTLFHSIRIRLARSVQDENCGYIVKIGDFGMGNFISPHDGLLRGRCGTPGYVAPEILQAGVRDGYSNRVDVFSLGVVAYVMLCGYEPFYGVSDCELVASNRGGKVSFLEGDWAQHTDEAKEVSERSEREMNIHY